MKGGDLIVSFSACVFAVICAGLFGFFHDDLSFGMDSREKLLLHRALTRNWMNWEDSTTPIPISYAAKLTKSILAGEVDNLPEKLAKTVSRDGYQTVHISRAWDYIRSERLEEIKKMCTADEKKCKAYVNYADKRFGLTPLHLSYFNRDEKLSEYLMGLGADPSAIDVAGRKPLNMSFPSFVNNSRKWAKQRGSACEIPEVIADETGEWAKEAKRLIREGEPVIIRGVVTDKVPTLEELVSKFGNVTVRVGSVPYADYFGLNIEHLKLSQFVARSVRGDDDGQLPMYVFAKDATINSEFFELMATLVRKAFPVPDIFDDPSKIGPSALHFALGREGSGAPMHIHSDALNLVLAGKKRWFVLPPQDAIYSRKHISTWVKEDLPTADPKPLECVQNAGDAIYVPFDWAHGVINSGEFTFAFALELLSDRESLKAFKW